MTGLKEAACWRGGINSMMISSATSKKILAIVPAYNERGNIARTVAELNSLKLPITVLVVDDGSCDGTKDEAVRSGALVISLPFNTGIGGAVQTGFKFALKEGFDVAVQVDGDGQHDAVYVEALLRPVLDEKSDLVIGSRFIPPYLGYRSSFVRRIGINFFARLISMLTGFKITDPTSGFRAYSPKIIKAFASYYPQDFPEPEAIMVVRRLGARLTEVPVQMRKRTGGRSSIRYLKTLYYMIKVTFAILLDMVKKGKAD